MLDWKQGPRGLWQAEISNYMAYEIVEKPYAGDGHYYAVMFYTPSFSGLVGASSLLEAAKAVAEDHCRKSVK